MTRFATFAVFLAFLSAPAQADIYKYTDENGLDCFVNDPDEIPAKYRDKKEFVAEESSTPEAETPKVEVFVTSWCGYCKKLEKFLDGEGIPYKKYDIEKDAAANATFKNLGGTGIPLTRVGDRVIKGYNPEGILSAIEAEQG